MTAASIAARADETSDRGSYAIRSDHECSRHLALPRATIPEAYAAHATVARPNEIDEVRLERDLGAGFSRGIDEQPVNDGTSRRIKAINVVLRFDLYLDDLVAIVKRRRSDHGRTRRFDSVENAPARQLNDAGSHEGMGRDRVAAVATTVDREHSKASSRKKHSGGCAGATGSDDDDVIVEGWTGTGCHFVITRARLACRKI